MILDINYLIDFFKKKSSGDLHKELDEQEAAGAEGGAKSGRAVKKWESGLTRGKANQVANTVWASGRKDGPTYSFDRKKEWGTGRIIGKTGGSDFA